MPPKLDPVRAVPCTYKDCSMSFDSIAEMKRHKKYSKEHDYCKKCDEDFESWDEYNLHKAFRPDNHGMACRVCGDEFKTMSGMKRHVAMLHRVDQHIECIGCKEVFPRASLLVQHLEFGHCRKISPHIFHGAIVHKFLVQRLLQNENGERDRFHAKMAAAEAAFDLDDEGGVKLEGPMYEGDDQCSKLPFQPMQVEVLDTAINPPKKLPQAWPALPSQEKKPMNDADALKKPVLHNIRGYHREEDTEDTLTSSFEGVSLLDSPIESTSNTIISERVSDYVTGTSNSPWKKTGTPNAMSPKARNSKCTTDTASNPWANFSTPKTMSQQAPVLDRPSSKSPWENANTSNASTPKTMSRQAPVLDRPSSKMPWENANTSKPLFPEAMSPQALVLERPSPKNPWENANTSKALFPEAHAKAALEKGWTVPLQEEDQIDERHGLNIFKTRFWDPTSVDYDPERFYEPGIGEYYCPFICEQTFSHPADLKNHIVNNHRITIMRCPRCQKTYGSATALIAHCESTTTKCGITHADDFATFLDRLSGGFLGATEEVRPDHAFNPTVMVPNESGDLEEYAPPAVGYLKYQATQPVDWKGGEEREVTRIDKRPV